MGVECIYESGQHHYSQRHSNYAINGPRFTRMHCDYAQDQLHDEIDTFDHNETPTASLKEVFFSARTSWAPPEILKKIKRRKKRMKQMENDGKDIHIFMYVHMPMTWLPPSTHQRLRIYPHTYIYLCTLCPWPDCPPQHIRGYAYTHTHTYIYVHMPMTWIALPLNTSEVKHAQTHCGLVTFEWFFSICLN